MGGGVSVHFDADADSVANPGTKVILSESIEAHCDYESFINELMQLLQTPGQYMDKVMKSEELKEITPGNPDEFTYKVVLDGKKMQSWGFGEGEDVVTINRYVKTDRAARTVTTWDYNDKENPDKVTTRGHTTCLKDPLRLEAYLVRHIKTEDDGKTWTWVDNPDGERASDDAVAAIWRDGFINPVCTTLSQKKAKSEPDQKGSDGQLCIKSVAVDKILDYDAVAAAVMPVFKEQDTGDKTTITEVSENEYTARTEYEIPGQEEKTVAEFRKKFDKETGEAIMEAKVNGKLARTNYMKITKDPVTFENWAIEDDGTRITGGFFTREASFLVNNIVKQAEYDGSLLGSLGGMFS